jgi:hypothetical protein
MVYAEQMYNLRDRVFAASERLPLSCFIQEPVQKTNLIKIESGRYYSNKELSVLFRQSGLNDFVLIGQGTDIEKDTFYDNSGTIAFRIKQVLPEVEADRNAIEKKMDFKTYIIKKLDAVRDLPDIRVTMDMIYFTNQAGIETNLTIVLRPGDISQTEEGKTGPDPADEPIYLKALNKGYGELIYRKAGLTIMTRVRVMRKLENNYYLVENNNSGKMMRVRFIDSID